MSEEKDFLSIISEKRQQLADAQKQLDEIESQIENLEKQEDGLEETIYIVGEEIRSLRKEHFESGFDDFKKDAKRAKPVFFSLTEEQVQKIRYIETLQDSVPSVSGGSTTVSFTPTSIGEVIKVEVNGEKYDLTDYYSF